MKASKWIIGFILVTFLSTLFAANEPEKPTPPKTITQPGTYGKELFESLDTTGLVKLNGTQISDTLRITGSLICREAEIGALDILGEANLTESTVLNGGMVMGLIQSVRSTFKKPITILSSRAIFTASTLDAIKVKQDSAYKGKQVIELRQGTIVNGPIHFESGKGEVIIFPQSQVLGVVTGGKVVKKL